MKNALKNSVKKIAAITGSAVMLGATMLGAMAAADFSTITSKTGASEFYTTGGALNAMVMVGTIGTDVLGAISDVAGAIDVAAAFAQKATLGGEGGGAIVAKNVTPGYLESTGLTDAVAYGKAITAQTFTSASTGFDWLRNNTVVYNDTAYFMEEKITVSSLGQLQFTGIFYWQGPGGVAFNISANQTMPLNFDQFTIKDQTYQIVAFANGTAGTVELGQLHRVEGVNVGGFVDVGTTGVKLKLTGIKQTYSAWKAVFDIYDTSVSETTPVVTGVEKAPGESSYSNDTLGIKFDVYTMYKDASDIWNVDVDWTEASIVLKNNNLTTSIFPGYYSDIGFNADTGVDWINFRSPGGWTADSYWPSTSFSAGDTVQVMPGSDGYFVVSYEQDRIGADTTIDEGIENAITVAQSIGVGIPGQSSFEITYKDNETHDAGVDLSNYLEMAVSGAYPTTIGPIKPTLDKTYYLSWYNVGATDYVAVQEADGSNLYLVGNVTCGANNTWTNTTDAGTWWYNVTCSSSQINLTMWKFVSNGSYFWNNLTFAPVVGDYGFGSAATSVGKLMLTEPTGENVYIRYNTTAWSGDYGVAIGTSPLIYDRTGGTDITFSGTSTSQYTQYGTLVSPSTNNFALLYPQYQRVAKIFVGRTAETTETVNVGDQISTTGWYLRSGGGESPVWVFSGPTANGIAALDSDSVTKPVILIGGPGANAKVKSLYDAGTALVMNGTALTPEANTAYVELVENAFSTNDAVIIAGTGAADTRMACKVVASQILYGTPLTNFEGTKLKLNTGVGTFSDVTAEAYT
jgi:hypothetical protein